MIPDFQIIIPTYNEEKNIKKTLHYITKQRTRASVRVVVVDGGSTDKTVEIANKYVKVLKSPKKGKAYQLNFAASKTNSKYLIFIDADTHLPPNYVEQVKKAYEKDEELWACSGPIIYVGSNFGFWHFFVVIQAVVDFVQFALFQALWFFLRRHPNNRFNLFNVNYFYNSAMLYYYFVRQVFGVREFSGSNICVRRDIFDEIGGFRQPPKLGVDMLFSTLLRKHIQKRRRGKMRFLPALAVETDVRHLETVRSLKRLTQHRTTSISKVK